MDTELQVTTTSPPPDRFRDNSDHALIALWLRGRRSDHTREAYARAGIPGACRTTCPEQRLWGHDPGLGRRLGCRPK